MKIYTKYETTNLTIESWNHIVTGQSTTYKTQMTIRPDDCSTFFCYNWISVKRTPSLITKIIMCFKA